MTTQAKQSTTNPWLVLIVLCMGFFMIMLDTTIVNVAVPTMLDDLGTSLNSIVWVLNAYLLAYAILLITAARLGDLWGPRNLFIAGLAVFTLASALCGMAQDSTQLIVARVAQGVGAALLTPQTLTIIATIFPPANRGAALGVWGSVVGLATVVGPTLGGVLVSDVSWRWIFFVNVPIGIVALVASLRFIPDVRPGRRHRLDLVGVGIASAGLFGVVYGLIEGQRHDWGAVWGPITIPMILIAGVALLVGFVFWERRPEEPLLALSLFRTRNFSAMLGLQTIIAFTMLGFYLPLVLVLQSVLGMSALKAGLTLAPLSVAAMLVAPFAGKLADKHGGKYILAVGMSLFALGVGLLAAVFAPDASQASFIVPMIIGGIGLGMCLAPLTAEAMRSVAPQQMGTASGMLNTTRQLGGLLGTAVVGALLQNRLAVSFADQARETAARLDVAPGVRRQFVESFSNVSGSGFQVAPGQNGGVQLPSGLPPATAAKLHEAAHDVFVSGFVDAAKPSVLVPAALVALGAIACAAVVERRKAPGPQESRPAPVAAGQPQPRSPGHPSEAAG
jgi:EmrB/QacA subfamily drug resistance transporter